MKTTANIRLATPADTQAMLDIYAPYIQSSTTSFEIEVPSLKEFQRRIDHVLKITPWLVSTINGTVAAYAYASSHRSRQAYQWSREVSVYVHDDFRKRGLATALYTTLVELLKTQGISNILAGIVLPNPVSISFHTHFGFQPVGIYHNVGYKMGQWCDVSWWELFVGKPNEPPRTIQPIKHWIGKEEWHRAVEQGLKFIRTE